MFFVWYLVLSSAQLIFVKWINLNKITKNNWIFSLFKHTHKMQIYNFYSGNGYRQLDTGKINALVIYHFKDKTYPV